ncbi:uncharacterized protein LOC125678093 isoform X2 [Ostrea edulis]|uniref:uncharacterized protein LOC125678093 isoform X2 n=1 Tax=Ostrea edulis TaxID=37623 RepID=UPI0024AFAC0C|nr:uncharacterized protein LOC125678093 isoform X2 [Ostrea edulis]
MKLQNDKKIIIIMKIIQVSMLLFCATNAAGFGLRRLFRDILTSQSGSRPQERGVATINDSNPSYIDSWDWEEDSDSASSEEGGLHMFFRFLYDGEEDKNSINTETTTQQNPQTSSPNDIDKEINSTTTETPSVTTTEENDDNMTNIETTTASNTDDNSTRTETPSTTTMEVSTDSDTTTVYDKTTTETAKTTTTERTTYPDTTLTYAQTTMSTTTTRDDVKTEVTSSTTVSPTTTAYYITTENTFIEGDLSIDDKVNKTDLNSTDDFQKIIDEYSDYIDQGPTRGDLPSTRTSSQNIQTTTSFPVGSGIIDASLSNTEEDKRKDTNGVAQINQSSTKTTANRMDVTAGRIGNILSDVVVQFLNSKQTIAEAGGEMVHQKSTSGVHTDVIDIRLGNDVTTTTSPPKTTVFFTPSDSQKNAIADSQQIFFTERVAKIGKDFIVLPDFDNGAVLLEPIVPAGSMKTDTISDFDYVPSKTLSYKTIPNSI